MLALGEKSCTVDAKIGSEIYGYAYFSFVQFINDVLYVRRMNLIASICETFQQGQGGYEIFFCGFDLSYS